MVQLSSQPTRSHHQPRRSVPAIGHEVLRPLAFALDACAIAQFPHAHTAFLFLAPITNPLGWDASWWLSVAQLAYTHTLPQASVRPATINALSRPASLPLLPWLLRAGHLLVGSWYGAEVLVSVFGFCVAALLIDRLARSMLSDERADLALALFAFGTGA